MESDSHLCAAVKLQFSGPVTCFEACLDSGSSREEMVERRKP
ncbi:hypothetical protein GFS60_02804 [Rhodococcus sp. WAY2]|nr:hypothetical protein GFS60_02804 [Rhodococcus sp. WAY2]